MNSDVLRQNYQEDIIKYLDLDAIRPHLVQCQLLTVEETERLTRQSSEARGKQVLTQILAQKGTGCVSQFLECLSKLESSGEGHRELLEVISADLDNKRSRKMDADSAIDDAPDPKRMRISGMKTNLVFKNSDRD